MQDFDGRTAVITGAASGIGRALARRCARLGMKIVVADVERGALDALAKDLAEDGAAVLPVPTDVAVADQVEALAERAQDAFGRIHLVCHNAGVFAAGLAWEAPLADYEWVFDVNVRGVVHGVRSFTPRQIEHGEPAHVVITASMAALTCTPFNAPYTMSKHAVLALGESLFLELEAKHPSVGVSVLCPELVATRIGASGRNRPEHRKREGPSHPEREMVENVLAESTATGLDPDAIAERTLDAVRERRLYVLPPEGDPWRIACEKRLDAIRAARNPSLEVPA